MKLPRLWKQVCMALAAVSITISSLFCSGTAYAAPGQTTIIMLDQAKNTYQVGDRVKVTIGVSSPDGSYLTKAYCGFGYNASTMTKLTETDTPDHIWIESDTPSKWLYGEVEFEMRADGKMYFIAGAYSGDGVIEAYRADGSRVECPRASVMYKIGTGIYTATSDCNLESCVVTDAVTGEEIIFNRGFDSNITEYWAEIPSSCDEIQIEAVPENAEDQIILPESLQIPAGESSLKVGVQAVSGETKDYVFHLARPVEEVSVKDIDLIDGSGNEISYHFDPEIYSYDIEVPENCDTIRFEAKTEGSTKVDYPASSDLTPGYSAKYVTASTDTETKTYEFYIYRALSSLSLSSLVIETSDEAVYPLTPEFDPAVTEYEMSVPSDVVSATVTCTVANENDYLKEEIGEIELTHGENQIPITVTDGVNEKTYQITIRKDERVVFEKETEPESGPPRNTMEHEGFSYIDLFLIGVLGMLLIAGVAGAVTYMTVRAKMDFNDSNEAVSIRQEKERKQRLKEIEEAAKKAEKEKKKRREKR